MWIKLFFYYYYLIDNHPLAGFNHQTYVETHTHTHKHEVIWSNKIKLNTN